jgi:uncharacterized delta-60 repeat protein
MRAGRTAVATLVLACVATFIAASPTSRAATSDTVFPLDTTWATNQPVPGLLRLQLSNLPDYATLVRVLPDGSAVVALLGISPSTGYGDGRVGIAKLRADGTLDPAFNPSGSLPGVADQLATTGIVDIDVDHQGRILIAGTNAVTRLLSDGTPDPTFIATCINPCTPGGEQPPRAPTGMVYVAYRVYDLAVLADDSIIVESSNEINQPPFVMHLTKLTATGDRDLTFNPLGPTPGVLVVDDYGPGHVLSQADGSYLLVAVLSSPPRLHRITAGGLLDTTFGIGGTAYPDVAGSDESLGQPRAYGQDIIVSLPGSPPLRAQSLARIHPDGTADTIFGNGGRLDLTPFGIGPTNGLQGFFVLSDGRIIIEVGGTAAIALARLTTDGHLDASFNPSSGTPGWLPVNPAPDPTHGHAIADLTEAPNGTLLAVGNRYLTGIASSDIIAEIYRFNSFPGAPQPAMPYPMSSPPPRIATITTSAAAGKPAVRLSLP